MEDARTGDDLLRLFSALSNAHRLRIFAVLNLRGRNYISQLARDVGMSRPLLHLHLKKLEEAGLVKSSLELSKDGKALNFFETNDFNVVLTPQAIIQAVSSLSSKQIKST